MGIKSKGRGTAAAFGLLLLFAGLIGGALLFVVSERRPGQAIDEFARAPIGCTTTLEFTETGTFFVFEEMGGVVEPPGGGCVPSVDPVTGFGFELAGGGGSVVPRRDDSILYEESDRSGRSVARFVIDVPGEYEIEVRGDDPAVVAAIGRDPDDGVGALRRGAVVVAIAGIVLGLLLLVLAGRRSKRAATYVTPSRPGSDEAQGQPAWPPLPPTLGQLPVNPHAPPSPVAPVEVAPLPERRRPDSTVNTWAPPSADQAASDAPPVPERSTPPTPPALTPTLPDVPARPPGGSDDERPDH